MKLSVVMAVYNEQRFLREALDSILVQTFDEFQFVIIDDGSTDETPAILNEYAQRDGRVRVVTQENQGLISSLNRGVELADTPLIARMDGDDIAVPQRFERQVAFLDAHGDVAVVGAAFDVIDADGRSRNVPPPPTEHDAIDALMKASCCIAHPTVMMRRDVVQQVGGYRQPFLHAEDYDLWLRIGREHRLANLAQVLHHRRMHNEQISLRHLRQQVLSTIAARAVDKIARRDGTDRGASLPAATRGVLHELEVDDAAIDAALVQHYLVQCDDVLQRGEVKLACTLLDDLSSQLGDQNRAIAGCAYLWWMRARVSLAMRRPLRACLIALRMLSADPAGVMRAFTARMSR